MYKVLKNFQQLEKNKTYSKEEIDKLYPDFATVNSLVNAGVLEEVKKK